MGSFIKLSVFSDSVEKACSLELWTENVYIRVFNRVYWEIYIKSVCLENIQRNHNYLLTVRDVQRMYSNCPHHRLWCVWWIQMHSYCSLESIWKEHSYELAVLECIYNIHIFISVLRLNEENTHIFVCVGVLVLWLLLGRNLTVWAIMFTVVIRSTMICYNHQLLNITLQTKEHKNNI